MEVIMSYLSTKKSILILSLLASGTPSITARSTTMWDPFAYFDQMEKSLWSNMNRMQQKIVQQAQLFEQKVEIKEEKDKTIILVRLSGFSKEDNITVKVDKKTRVLTISASKKEKKEEHRKNESSRFETEQSFMYQYMLKAGESEKIQTSLKDGLLTVIIPFSTEKEEESVVNIPVKYE